MSPASVHLFTDIEGSTRLWEEVPERMRTALERHDALARAAVLAHQGRVVKTTGDGVHAVFAQAGQALAAALQMLRGLAQAEADGELALAVRCGLHCSADAERDRDYYGPDVNRAARIMAAAHGGQLLVSQAVAQALADALPAAVGLRALGLVRLRDLAQPERLYQVVAPPLRTEFPPLRGLASVPHNLPQPLNRFIGRGEALRALCALLDEHRLVTLWGPGGIGKSRLSVQLATEVLDRFPDGAWLVELAPVADAAGVLPAVAAALGVKEAPGEILADAVLRHVRSRSLLLVLDNCEHVHAAAARVAKQLLQAGARLHIVATSREVLRVAGECTFAVPALSVPALSASAVAPSGGRSGPGGTAEALMRHEAVRLFVDRARLVQPAFDLDAGRGAAVVAICRRLDGIPLAIELAAARLRAMPVQTMAERLVDSFRLVATQDETVAPRQRTLRVLIDWSWDLLDAEERGLLARLSAFAGGFTLEAAEAVCADAALPRDAVLDLLGQLVDQSLVALQSDADPAEGGRWRLLEVIRAYAADRVPEAERAGLQQRHRACFIALAEAAAAQLDGPDAAGWLARLDADRANLLQAHGQALAEADPARQPQALDDARRLGFALRDYCINRGLLSTGLEMVRAVLAHPLARGADATRARTLFDAGQLCNRLGRHAEARDALEESLAIVRALGATVREASILQPLGLAYDRLGDAARARACYDTAIAVARRQGLPLQLASALVCLAQWHQVRQHWEAAEPLYRQALEAAHAQAADGAEATIALNLGMVALQRGRADEARARVRGALGQARASGSSMLVLGVLDLCCGLAVHAADWARARRTRDAALALCARTGLCREAADEAFLQPWLQRLQDASALERDGLGKAERREAVAGIDGGNAGDAVDAGETGAAPSPEATDADPQALAALLDDLGTWLQAPVGTGAPALTTGSR